MATGVGAAERIVDDVEIGSEQHLKRLFVERVQVVLFHLKRFDLYEIGEKLLDFIEVVKVKKNFFFRRSFQYSCNRLIVEQQVNAVHTLSQKMFNLIDMGFANLELFHLFRFDLKTAMGKGKRSAFD